MAKRSRLVMVRLPFVVLVATLAFAGAPRSVRAGLDEYVKKPDSSFAWSQTSSLNTPGGTITTLALTSQVWQGITWKHELTVYDPRELTHADAMLLFITGGDHNSKQNDNDHKQGFMPGPALRRAGRRLAPGPQPTAAGRQDRGRADRRDVRPLPPDQGRELAAALSHGQERGPGDGCPASLGQARRQAAWSGSS